MGNEESILSEKPSDKSTDLTWNDLFSLQYISELFKKYMNQDTKNIYDSSLDSVYFSSLIENLIFSKSKPYQINIHNELEKSFFSPLVHDIGIEYDRTQIFTKCFDEMRSTANTIFECEKIIRKRNKESIVNSFHSLQTQKTPTSYLEDFFTIPFNSLLPLIHVLSPPELASSLSNLNDILSERKNWSLDTYESTTIMSVQNLIKQICQIEKFRVPEIQILIIQFLFNFANAHGNVNSILSTLQIMLSFPANFTANFDEMIFDLQGPKITNKNLFTFPLEIDSKILSFSIGSNILVLAEGIGLIQLNQPDPLIIPINFSDDSILLDSYKFIYIFSIKLGTIQCFTNKDLNIQSMRILDISKYVNIKHKILVCGKFKQKIAILQNYGQNKYRITIFENDLENNPNKVSEIKLTLKTIDDESIQNFPKFYYFNKDEVHFIYDDMIDKPFKIILNENKIEKMPDLICDSFIADGCPVCCFKNVLYSLSQRNGKILFIKNEVSHKTKLKKLPFTFTTVNLPVFNGSNVTLAISLMINELTAFIDSQLLYLFENRFIKYISFFVSPDNSTFEMCFSLLRYIIPNNEIDNDTKTSLTSLLFKIITVNLISHCIKFSKNMKSFNDKDRTLFTQIKELIELAVFSPFARNSPLIIESISVLISSNFHYLYYPDYSTFNEFIQRILSNNSLRHHLILNFMMISTNHCFLYMFSNESIKILNDEINDENGIQEMFNNSLLSLTDELQFLLDNEIKSNEEFILPYFDFLFSFIESNTSFDFSSKLIQNLIFRLMLIDSFPLIAMKVVDKSIPIINKYIEILKKDQKFIENDKKYSDDNKLININNQDNEIVVLESNHDCEPKSEISKEIKFTKSSIIHLSFDKRCNTDPNNSNLKIYDNSKSKTLLYNFSGDNWLDEIDIFSNSILIEFNDHSNNSEEFFWGYKITITPKIIKGTTNFKPYLNLFYFNLLINTLGRLTFVGLKSIAQSIEEIENKFILEGDLLEGVTKVFNQKETQIQLQKTGSKTFNKPMTRGLSTGLGFDAFNTIAYTDEAKKEFINDLIFNDTKETTASCLLKYMYETVRAPHLIKPNQSILIAEKYMIAALMKQLGLINLAIYFGSKIQEKKNNNNESLVIPPNLDKIWKSIYRMRTRLYRSYQKSKAKNISKQNQTENVKTNVKLREDFDTFIKEIVIKCKFLLFTEPILKIRNYETENYDMETIEKTINELLTFITSELLMENLNRKVKRRTQKIKIRTQTLSLMIKVIESEIMKFNTTKMAYLYPLKTSIKLLADISDVKSVPHEMINELNNKLFDLFERIISMITDPNETDSTRLFYIKMISVNIEDVVQTKKIVPMYLKVAEFIKNSNIQSIESFVTVSCLWRILGLWTLEFPSTEIINKLLSFSTNSEIEFCQYHSILLLCSLSQTQFSFDQYKAPIPQIIKCFKNASPRVVVATLMWLSSSLFDYKTMKEIEINGIKYNSESFIHFLLKAIGSSLCGGPCLLIPDESLQESHMIVAEEIINFFRVLIHPHSLLKTKIIKVFHQVLSSSINSVLTKYALNKNIQKDDEIFELIAIFTVLGKEIVSFHNSGYSILHAREMSELIRVTSYDPISNQLKFIMMNNNFNEITSDRTSKFVPSTRFPSNPNNFLITADEVKSFVLIQNEIVSLLDNITNVNFSILSSSFIGFLTVCLQNEQNAKTFIENADLTTFLNCAKKKKNLKKATGIENLINKINREVIKISNVEKKWNDSKIVDKKLNYSLVFHYDSPQIFIPLTEGRVDQNRIYTSSNKPSLFVGDRPLPNTAIFYFEVKIVSFTSKHIGIGFIDHQSTLDTIRINGIGLKNESIFSSENRSNHIKSGDVIGCEYSNEKISFYYNGIKLKHSIPSCLLDGFVPAIATRDCEAIFEYNFGRTKFVTDMKERIENEILLDSYEKFDVKVPNEQILLPTTNSIENDEYDIFINNSKAVWEISKTYPNNENEEEYFENNVFHLKEDKTSGTLGELSFIRYINAQYKYCIGQPVLITKDDSNDSPFNSPSFTSQLHFNKHGTIVGIQSIPREKDLFLFTIESIDPMKNKKYRFQVSSKFVTPINSKFMKIIENSCRIYIEKVPNSKEEKELMSSIVPVYLNRQKKRLFRSTRSLIIRMCRFLSLIFVDYYRLNNSISSYFDNYKTTSIDVFSLAISDVFKFIPKPKISPKWSQYRLSDFIFNDDKESENFSIGHFCLCNTHKLSRFIRAIIYQNANEIDSILVQLVSNSIDQISHSKNSSREGIFNLVSKRFILELIQPLNDNKPFSHCVVIPDLCNGFIPVIDLKSSIGENKIKLNGHEYKELKEFDYTIFNRKECSVSFKSSTVNNFYGFRFCVFPLRMHLNERVSESQLGGIHILFTLLSAILSDKNKDKSFSKTTKFLKQEVVSKIASLMNKENFFVDLFAFEIIQPILMSLKWNSEDVKFKFEEAFKSFTAGLHEEIKKWEPLHNRVQQGVLISLFTQLLILDISTESNKNLSNDDIACIYDTFVKSKINKNSSVNDQLIEAVATCVALGFDMPTPIKFPSFLIAEKWASCFPCKMEVAFEPGKTKIDIVDCCQLKEPVVEFVNEDWMPKNVAMKVKVLNDESKQKSQPNQKTANKAPQNSDTKTTTTTTNSNNNSNQSQPRDTTTNNTTDNINTVVSSGSLVSLGFGESAVLRPGERISVCGNFSAHLVDYEGHQVDHSILDSSSRFRIKVIGIPLTHESRRLNFVTNFSLFKKHVQLLSIGWDVRYDEALSRILKSHRDLMTKEYNRFDDILAGEPILSSLPKQSIECRLELFGLLEYHMSHLIKVVDIGNNETILGSILSCCRSSISTSFKLDVVKSVVEKGIKPDSTPVDIKFNRFQASLFHSDKENPLGKSLLDQVIEQVPFSKINRMKRRGGAPWKVDLIGEGATDAGGPGRDLFTECCMELMNQSLGLFVPNPNKRVNNSNGNQELLIPNPQTMTSQVKNRFIYAGILIAICYVSSIPEPFKFPRFFWDFLTNKPVSIEDIYDVDLQFKQLMTSIESFTDSTQFSDIFSLSFQVQNSLGEMVDLIPGGSCVLVTFNKRLEYVQRCKNYRIKEFNDQLLAVREGFNMIFPSAAASILTPWEIELLICGDNKCPLEELKKNCNYEAQDPHSLMLFDVLGKFSPEERMLFIKFGCGRMGLPPPGMNWHSKLTIRFKEFNELPDSLKPLPTAVTCNSKVTIPRYNSIEVMEKKIRTAITMGADIDQDRNARINDLEDVT